MTEVPVPAQIEPAAAPGGVWDAVVVGAGPAGSMAALVLARRGRRVLLIDRAAFPREKVCGDALIPDALRCLDSAGLAADVRALGHITPVLSIYSADRSRLDVPVRCVTLKRARFDAFLAARAVDAGTCFVRGRVQAIDTFEEYTAVTLGDGSVLRTRHVIVATGAEVGLLEPHGVVERPLASAMAARCYVRSSVAIDELVISYDGSIAPGYAWIFPMGGGEYNIGCGRLVGSAGTRGMNLRQDFAAFVASFPLARAVMARATSASKLLGARLRCGLAGVRPAGPGPVLSAGEVIGATFPLTGEGIGKAMETAVMAAEAVDLSAGGLSASPGVAYERRLQALRPRYRGYEIAQRWIEWPSVGNALVRRAQRSAYLQDAIQGILDETTDPRAVFSVRGLARSWLGGPHRSAPA